MRTRIPCIFAVLIAVTISFAPSSVSAQFNRLPPPNRPIPELLASDKPFEQAWGAKLAADAHETKYIPDILRLLQLQRDTEEAHRVPYYAFDALMRLDATVPEATVRGLMAEYSSAVVALAGKSAAPYKKLLPELLDVVNNSRDRSATWKLLEENPTPGFTERVLRDWTLNVRLAIFDPLPPTPSPDAFEEIAITTSNFSAEYGSISDCATERAEFPRFPFPAVYPRCVSMDRFSIDFERQRYVEAVYRDLSFGRSTHFLSSEQVAVEADKLRAEAERAITTMLAALKEKGSLPKDSTVRPKVHFTLTDNRKDKTVPLPPVPPDLQ